MSTRQELLDTQSRLKKELEVVQARIAEWDRTTDPFARCRYEARQVAQHMDDWDPRPESVPFANDLPLSALFLGAVSGEWAAQSRYRGELPGFGGFMLVADGMRILVDPGRSTLSNLHAAGIHPRSLSAVISTHAHWDCVRDLPLVVMAAAPTHTDFVRRRSSRLHLYAPRSVLFGSRTDRDAVLSDNRLRDVDDGEALRTSLADFPTSTAAGLSMYDVLFRLNRRYTPLDIGCTYRLTPTVEIRTRASYHPETFGVGTIPAIDLVVWRNGHPAARCVYLSDTEYRPALAGAYAADTELGAIDLLICNVKTLDFDTCPKGEQHGFTRRHLGWKGVVRLTRDFRERNLLTNRSLVVLRAWGIETVTRLDAPDGVMIATPEKLGVYEQRFLQETGQAALVPGTTWLAMRKTGDGSPEVHHLRRPFEPEGTFRRFGNLFYCSQAIAEVVRAARTVAETPLPRPVLITGESGTGKDEMARSIHIKRSPGAPLIVINAHAQAEQVGWRGLVGSCKGAFTGADCNHEGLFASAAGGTLLLQEVGEMPHDLQMKLLTVLDERSYWPLGGKKPMELKATVIMTTNADMNQVMRAGKFRDDLYYRVGTRLHIPPLRERIEDMAALVHCWRLLEPAKFACVGEKALDVLQRYPWPGNARSVRKALEKFSGRTGASLDDLRRFCEQEKQQVRADSPADGLSLDPQEEQILRSIPVDGLIRRADLEGELPRLTKTVLANRLHRLVERGLLRRVGGGPSTRYRRSCS